jgi:hypothetical protein
MMGWIGGVDVINCKFVWQGTRRTNRVKMIT